MSKLTKNIAVLSGEMQRLINAVKSHGSLIRYEGGFWHIPNCKLKPGYNGGRIEYYVPIYNDMEYFSYGTIKALKNRGLIKVTSFDNYGNDKEVKLV
jgi:hypothetical protein